MARALSSLLITLLCACSALLIGLAGASLRTGLLDPLDWLLPGTVAIIVLAARGSRHWSAKMSGTSQPDRGGQGLLTTSISNTTAAVTNPWSASFAIWAIVTLPSLVLLAQAGTHVPYAGMALLAACLAIVALVWALLWRRTLTIRVVTFAALIAASLIVPRVITNVIAADRAGESARRPLVGIFTAMPLQGVAMGAAHGLPAAESVGLRSPLWQALETHFRLLALDALDGDALAGFGTVLLAQPRTLSPQELVALDAWVRAGGRAIILADPLLQWPDPRPLAHPDRAPLTSLLDPLLSHWGLRLEAAEFDADGDPIERRLLGSNVMLQLAGSSRFTPVDGAWSTCTPSDAGLLARCPLGRGQALLVADADWIDDSLWTLTPDLPGNRRAWTSDALDVLVAWLEGGEAQASRFTSWIVGEQALVRALRAALLTGLFLTVIAQLAGRHPRISHRHPETKRDEMWNIGKTEADTP